MPWTRGYGPGVRFLLLGPVAVEDDQGEDLPIGGPRVRAVLAALLLAAERGATPDRLIADVWGEELPEDPVRALHIAISRVRRGLGAAERVDREGGRYRLDTVGDEIDLAEFEREVAEGRRLRRSGAAAAAADVLREALARWRGTALGGLGDVPLVRSASPRLEELRLQAVRDRFDAELAADRHEEVLPELRGLVDRHPLDERLRGLLMVALYRSGRQGAALEAFRTARETLVRDVGADPGPALEALHQRILVQDPGLRSSNAPPGTPARGQQLVPGDLGASSTTFVGRGGELDGVGDLLDRHRLVTLTGTGGTGKTRLALELTRRRAADHPGGRWLVDLAPVATPQRVVGTLARILGLGGLDDGDARLAVTGALARAGPVLLVLDNAEHVRGAVADLATTLLSRCPDTRLLVTSRIPLGLPPEHLWSLRGLPVLPPGEPATAAGTETAASRLFVDRAQAAVPTFRPSPEDHRAIAEICRRVAGLPLAIELAAAWVRVLACAEIADQLHSSGAAVLSAATTSPSQRHASLEATLDWSYDRLAPADQSLLLALAVFRGRISLAAAQHVEGADGRHADVVAGLGRLVADSLVEGRQGPGGRTGFRLLEPVRQYALGHLQRSGELEAVREAHASWCLRTWRDVNQRLRTSAGELGPDFLEALVDEDLHAALEWALDNGREQLALELVAAAYVYWWTYGRMVEGLEWAVRATESAPRAPSPSRVAALAAVAFLGAHVAMASPARWSWSRVAEAAEAARSAARQVPATERPVEAADAAIALGQAKLEDGDPDAAEPLGREGLRIAEEHGDPWAVGYARTAVLAAAATRRDDLDAAVAAYQALLRDLPAAASTAHIATHFNLGELALAQQRFADAREHFETVLAMKTRARTDPFGQRHSNLWELLGLARAAAGVGDHVAARGYADQALEAVAGLEDPDLAERCQEALAGISSLSAGGEGD